MSLNQDTFCLMMSHHINEELLIGYSRAAALLNKDDQTYTKILEFPLFHSSHIHQTVIYDQLALFVLQNSFPHV